MSVDTRALGRNGYRPAENVKPPKTKTQASVCDRANCAANHAI